MDRRQFLSASSLAVSASLAGCFDLNGTEEGGPPTRPWEATEPVDESDGTHHLFVENHMDATELTWLRVVDEDGTTLVDGLYDLPDGRGIEFEDLAAWGRTYTIDLAVETDTVHTVEWETPECGPDSETSGGGGSRNATVTLTTTGDSGDGPLVEIAVDQCDALVGPGLPVGPADDRRIEV